MIWCWECSCSARSGFKSMIWFRTSNIIQSSIPPARLGAAWILTQMFPFFRMILLIYMGRWMVINIIMVVGRPVRSSILCLWENQMVSNSDARHWSSLVMIYLVVNLINFRLLIVHFTKMGANFKKKKCLDINLQHFNSILSPPFLQQECVFYHKPP